MTAKMSVELATSIVRDCFAQDMGNEGLEALLTVDADEAVANWRKYSAEAGDLAVVAAIDALGLDAAAGIWERELVAAERAAA
jgi:hypothetical protein